MLKLLLVFYRLVNVADSGLHSRRYGELSKQRLDSAILILFINFRKSHAGDQAMHSSKRLYVRLSDLIGLNDHQLTIWAALYFNNMTMGEAPMSPAAINLSRHIAECPALLPVILETVFEIVLFEDCTNQWSLSRPMSSLILINESDVCELESSDFGSQAVDQHQRLASCFDKLMADIFRSLDSKNRDKFTQNLRG